VTRPERILVTGGAGFVGSTLVDHLLAEGREVVAFDSFDPFYPKEQKERNLAGAKASSRFQFVEGDIRDADAVDSVFRVGQFDAVVHLAALAGVRPSLERPALYADVNVHGTSLIFEAAAKHGNPRVVFASSSSVYGEREDGPFLETDPVDRPISTYAATKRAAELIAHTFHHACDLSITCARIFTVYGPRQRPDLAIRKFADRMRNGKSIPVFGDGQSLRDFTYVDDLVGGLVQAVDKDLGYVILNFGGGRKVSVLEVIKLLEKTLEVSAHIEWLPSQVGDVRRTWSDTSAAREALGFEPSVSLEEGIERFVAWLREQA
jgi:UDP-glucuronate 4-epimerase